jgi:uncharacterized membrane protein YesL
MSSALGESREVREPTFLAKLWADSWPNLAGLLGANLLFLLWCVPAALAALVSPGAAVILALLTVVPGVLGLLRYAGNLVLERRASVWRDSLWGFRSALGTGILVGALVTLALAANQLALSRASTGGEGQGGAVALWVAQLGVVLVLSLTLPHLLSLVALYDQPLRHAFRNAVILTLAHPMPAIGLVSAATLAALLARALAWGPLIILPSLLAVLAVNTSLMLVQRHPREGQGSKVGG